jgi:hypothetical protein
MVGIARRLLTSSPVDPEKVARAYDALLNDSDYQYAVGKATARVDQVTKRLNLATEAFKDV